MEKLKELIDDAEVVSFDLFDTLLLRPFVKPQDVFAWLEIAQNRPGFCVARMKAERQARVLKLVKERKEDCSLDDIYALIPEIFQNMKVSELELEEHICVRNEQMFEVFEYARKKHKKVIIVTDTYFSKQFIEKLLLNTGITNYDGLFVSSEIGLTKATGNLFDFVSKQFDVNPKDILHVGDNIIADYENAQKKGMRAFYSVPLVDRFFSDEHHKRFVEFYKCHSENAIVSALLGMQMIFWQNHFDADYAVTLGYSYGGPLAISAVLNVMKQAMEKHLTDLLFVARDAFFLQEVYDKLTEKKSIPSYYVYVNRNLKIKYENRQSEDNNFKKYVNSWKFCGNRVGIVDTSAGTFSVQKLLLQYLPAIDFYGLYMHTRTCETLNYINLSGLDLDVIKSNFNLNLIEVLLTSEEPKIEDVSDNKPIFEQSENEYETIKRSFFRKVLQGERLFVADFQAFFKKCHPLIPLQLVYQLIECFWKGMDAEDKKNLGDIKNSVDTQQKIYVSLVDENKDKAAQLRAMLLKNKK